MLEAAPGTVLADVGAGSDAPLTIPMARQVGPSGRIYATELGEEALAGLRRTVAAAGLDNVVVVEGHASRTNLPAACCDGIFMRNVYHHFADPPAMNASLAAALRPGGRLAVIDFASSRGEAAAPGDRTGDLHGVSQETVVRELRAAGFEPVVAERREDGSFLVVMRRPTVTP